jgi:hypothetical protein
LDGSFTVYVSKDTKCVKMRGKRHLSLAALTTAFFPWPQTEVDREHGRRYLKDRQRLFRVPRFPFLNPTQAEAYPT